jgi:hypothetical protein
MQTILVIAAIAGAAFWLGRRFFGKKKNEGCEKCGEG